LPILNISHKKKVRKTNAHNIKNTDFDSVCIKKERCFFVGPSGITDILAYFTELFLILRIKKKRLKDSPFRHFF